MESGQMFIGVDQSKKNLQRRSLSVHFYRSFLYHSISPALPAEDDPRTTPGVLGDQTRDQTTFLWDGIF